VLEFRADGALARRSHHNPDGSEWTTTYEYNDAGRLTAACSENGGGLVDLQFYEYDTPGRLIRVFARPQGGGDRIVGEDVGGELELWHVIRLTASPVAGYADGSVVPTCGTGMAMYRATPMAGAGFSSPVNWPSSSALPRIARTRPPRSRIAVSAVRRSFAFLA
jgi:YD repeat-containing protein